MINRRLQLAVLTVGMTLWSFGAHAVWAQETTTTTTAIPVVTTQTLNVENVQSLKITPVHEERVSSDLVLQDTISPNANGEFILHRKTIVGLDPIAMLDGKETHDIVQISGKTEPFAFVTLNMRAVNSPRTEVTRANKSGRWQINIAVDFLAAGEHAAYIQTELNGVKSDEIVVAKFVVVARDTVSNSTWLFIGLITVAIMLLLVATTLQIRLNRKTMDDENPEPVVVPATHKDNTKRV